MSGAGDFGMAELHRESVDRTTAAVFECKHVFRVVLYEFLGILTDLDLSTRQPPCSANAYQIWISVPTGVGGGILAGSPEAFRAMSSQFRSNWGSQIGQFGQFGQTKQTVVTLALVPAAGRRIFWAGSTYKTSKSVLIGSFRFQNNAN
jgi:hypothetical protein